MSLRIEDAPELANALAQHAWHELHFEMGITGVNVDCSSCNETIVEVRA